MNKIYEEQIELYNIFHHENSHLSYTNERKVRICLNCKMYYKTDFGLEDVNINLCTDIKCPGETRSCFRKLKNH